MKYLLFAGLVLLANLLTGCQNKTNNQIREVFVADPPAAENLSTLVESYEIIQLDRTPEAYITNPDRTVYTDSLILIKNESNQSILVFDNEGKYLNTISMRGRGPNEYLYITDFTYDPDKKTVSIFDRDFLKEYSLDGRFIASQNIGFSPSKATKLGEGLTIVEKKLPTGDSISDFHIRLVNSDFKAIDARIPIKPLAGPGFGIEGQTIRTSINGDHAYFYSYSGDTVFHIDQSSIKPVTVFKFKRDIITITDGTGQYAVDPNEAIRYLGYHEIGDLNLLFYNFKNSGYCFAFNSSDSTSRLFKSTLSIKNTYNGYANIMVDAAYLEKFIESNDIDKTKFIGSISLDSILTDSLKDFQCIIRMKFKPL